MLASNQIKIKFSLVQLLPKDLNAAPCSEPGSARGKGSAAGVSPNLLGQVQTQNGATPRGCGGTSRRSALLRINLLCSRRKHTLDLIVPIHVPTRNCCIFCSLCTKWPQNSESELRVSQTIKSDKTFWPHVLPDPNHICVQCL